MEMNSEALLLVKIIIGMGSVVGTVILICFIAEEVVSSLIPALKLKYITRGKDEYGQMIDLNENQRAINFYLKSTRIKAFLIGILIGVMFLVCLK